VFAVGAEPASSLGSFGLLVLAVGDVARARRFYEEAFGWRIAVDVGVFVELEGSNGMRVGLYSRKDFAQNTTAPALPSPGLGTTSTELYVRVESVRDALDRLVACGARVLSPPALRPWGDQVAYATDPDGNVVAVARHVKEG